MGSLACVAYWGKALADYPLCARRKPESTGAVRHGSMLKYEFSGPGRWHLTEPRLVPGSPSLSLWEAALARSQWSYRVP